MTVDPIAPTYLWRGPENKRPENALIGVMYVGDNVRDRLAGFDYVVVNAADLYYRNTGFSEQARATKLVGYEWDAVVDNGLTPSGLVVLAHSPTRPEEIAPGLLDTALASVSNAARYTAPSGAKVFASGSIQFAWGVDSGDVKNPRPDPRIKQFVINILGDMGAQPLTPDAGMIVPR